MDKVYSHNFMFQVGPLGQSVTKPLFLPQDTVLNNYPLYPYAITTQKPGYSENSQGQLVFHRNDNSLESVQSNVTASPIDYQKHGYMFQGDYLKRGVTNPCYALDDNKLVDHPLFHYPLEVKGTASTFKSQRPLKRPANNAYDERDTYYKSYKPDIVAEALKEAGINFKEYQQH